VTQLDLIAECKVPPRGTQGHELLMALKAGKRLTVARALVEHGVYALSQRMGELRRMGWPITVRMVKVGRATVAEYSL
jgi:hypothetical protein